MRRLCLFSGGLALAAALYVYAVHAAPWPLLLGLAVLCGGLFLLRKAGTRRAAVCVLGLLTGFAWCRGYEALFLRPLERYAGQELPFAAEALAVPQQTTYGQSCEVRLKLGGQSCTAVLYFDEADADIRPGDTLSGLARITTAQERLRRGSDYDISRGLLLSASCRGKRPRPSLSACCPRALRSGCDRLSRPSSLPIRPDSSARCCWATAPGCATPHAMSWRSRGSITPSRSPACTCPSCWG